MTTSPDLPWQTCAADAPLQLRAEHGVLWLQLNRPAALNALTREMLALLESALPAAATCADIRVLVLHGAGRGFCAGTDLRQAQQRNSDPAANADYIAALYRVTSAIAACPRPVIAAVHGACVAGGLELALCCDFTLAAASARLGDAHANYAMFPGGGATVRLPRRIGHAQAARLLFTGELLAAEEALRIGLVDAIAPDAQLLAKAEEMATRIAAKSPLVLARMKEALRTSMEQPASLALKRERELYDVHATSFDRAEGLTAFREQRPPRFEGR